MTMLIIGLISALLYGIAVFVIVGGFLILPFVLKGGFIALIIMVCVAIIGAEGGKNNENRD